MKRSSFIAAGLLALASLAPLPLGAVWMALAPRWGAFRARRGLLTALTWCATRVLLGALVLGVLALLYVVVGAWCGRFTDRPEAHGIGLPLGILLVIQLIPPGIMAEHRAVAQRATYPRRNIIAAAVIVVIWLVALAAVGSIFYRLLLQ